MDLTEKYAQLIRVKNILEMQTNEREFNSNDSFD